MHMADALVTPVVAGTMYALSTGAAGISVKNLRVNDNKKIVPVMGVMGAFVFAAQMINFTIPGTGSSGHLCGGMLLSAMIGPEAGFLTMIGVLLIQCLLFADGGILAFGCNVWNMAFYGCFIGGLIIWKSIMKSGINKKKIWIASVIGCIMTLQMGAFSVVLQTKISGITELPFGTFAGLMQPIHLAIGLVEGLITATVLTFVYEARPELLYGYDEASTAKEGRLTFKKTMVVLVTLTVLVGGALSYVASEYPDGLEWSIEGITGSTELENEGSVYETAGNIQEKTSILPDYAFKNSDSAAGTAVSGIVGSGIVLLLCAGICKVIKGFRKTV